MRDETGPILNSLSPGIPGPSRVCFAEAFPSHRHTVGPVSSRVLHQAWPTKADFEEVAKYTGPTEHLRDVEQCIKQILGRRGKCDGQCSA